MFWFVALRSYAKKYHLNLAIALEALLWKHLTTVFAFSKPINSCPKSTILNKLRLLGLKGVNKLFIRILFPSLWYIHLFPSHYYQCLVKKFRSKTLRLCFSKSFLLECLTFSISTKTFLTKVWLKWTAIIQFYILDWIFEHVDQNKVFYDV